MKEPQLQPERIAKLMDSKGWEITDLATRAEIPYITAYRIVKNQRPNVQADTIIRIARALDCSVEYLMGLTDSRSAQYSTLDATLVELIDAAKSLPDSRRLDLLLMARSYLIAGGVLRDEVNDLLTAYHAVGGDEAYGELLARLRTRLDGKQVD